jgi:hypothetical protein
MPKYDLTCPTCGTHKFRVLRTPLLKQSMDVQADVKACPKGCSTPMKLDDPHPSANVVEVLDNGAMSRKVERFADAQRLWKERANNDPRNQK